jgi:hypothetical protein
MQNSVFWVTKQNTEVVFWSIAIHYALQENDNVPTGSRYADGHHRHSLYKPTAEITLSAQENRRHNDHRRFTG